jgi:hypothetical protein
MQTTRTIAQPTNPTAIRSAVVSGVIALASLASAAWAQSNVVDPNKFAWGENVGWINFRDANSTTQGVRMGPSFLSGFAWGENIGWINLGDGTPANNFQYANINGTDFGVNRDPGTNALSGLAWGENVGWINFTLPSLPLAQRPRYDAANGSRLAGYAWGENIGWINLDVAIPGQYVAFPCGPADIANTDGDPAPDGFIDNGDFTLFFSSFFLPEGNPDRVYADIANTDGDLGADGFVDNGDFTLFFSAFFAGCTG